MTPRINKLVLTGAIALALPLAACGSDSKSAASTAASTGAPTVAPTAAPVNTTAAGETSVPVETAAPVESVAPADTAAADTTVATGPVVIEVDADSGGPLAQTVALGTELSIHVVTATAQEWHLHGYDIELEGTDVTFEFTATKAGEFELEGHDTEAVVLTLTVTS
jgi:hypothetical protein